MDVSALEAQIADDRAAGLTPACVAATAGTVNTGTIDPLDRIAELCRAERIWFHVDAAYGGPAALVPELADLYRGLEEADSIAIDPHKWMYVPVECGCAMVRDAQAMRDAFSLVPPYLRDDTALPWFSEFGIQQSRGFSLKLWIALRHIGLSGYRRLISRHRAARCNSVREATDFELVAGPLSVTCFSLAALPPPADADVDRLNRHILEVQSAGHAFDGPSCGAVVLRAHREFPTANRTSTRFDAIRSAHGRIP
jgi:glutamate/tyrosine decarboxylase-like PLP-dependent enzyme